MKVFVSHAGEDKEACSKLLKHLVRQDAQFFDYTMPYEESVVGSTLDSRMKLEIQSSDLVVALVSKNSTSPEKKIVLGEIHDALEQGFLERNRFIAVQLRDPNFCPPYWIKISAVSLRQKLSRSPQNSLLSLIKETDILSENHTFLSSGHPVRGWLYRGDLFISPEDWKMIQDCEDRSLISWLQSDVSKSWFGPFSRIQSRAWAHIDNVEVADFSYVARLICNRLGQDYKPPAPADSRLPLFDKLQEVIEDKNLPEYLRQDAMRLIDGFFDFASRGEWEAAIVSLHSLRSNLSNTQVSLYFPHVVEGVCQLRLRKYDLAEKSFLAAKDSGGSEDENVIGGLSKVNFSRSEKEPFPAKRANLYESALRLSTEAIALRSKKPDDQFANARMDRIVMAFQILEDSESLQLASPELHKYLEVAKEDFSFLNCLEPQEHQFEDHIKWRQLIAMKSLHEGDLKTALSAFNAILDKPLGTVELSDASFAQFPHSINNYLLAELADVGIVLDEIFSSHLDSRVSGEKQDFILMDSSERGFRFLRKKGGTNEKTLFKVHALDASITLRCFQLQAQQDGAIKTQNVKQLSDRAKALRNPELARHVLVAWDQMKKPRKAREFLKDLQPSIFHGHPNLILDRMIFERLRGDDEAVFRSFREFKGLIASLLKTSLTESGYSAVDFLELIAQAFDITDQPYKSQALREILTDLLDSQ